MRIAIPSKGRLREPSVELLHDAGDKADLPAVGDWVAIDPPVGGQSTIRAVLTRRTAFTRTAASDQHRVSEQQVVAANVDTVFLVQALAEDFNLRRLERYLVLAWESGAQPVVVLTKADLSDDVDGAVAEVESIDPATRSVTTTDGERISGDALVLAAGSQPNLRDSGHSAPTQSERMRQNTRLPGAARAIFSTSAWQSTA